MLLSILYAFIFLLSHRDGDSPVANCVPPAPLRPPFPQFVPRQTYQASLKDKQNSITQMALWDFLQLTNGKNIGHNYCNILRVVNVKFCAVCVGNHLHLSVARSTTVTTVSLDRDLHDVRIEVLRNLDSHPILKRNLKCLPTIHTGNKCNTGWVVPLGCWHFSDSSADAWKTLTRNCKGYLEEWMCK